MQIQRHLSREADNVKQAEFLDEGKAVTETEISPECRTKSAGESLQG